MPNVLLGIHEICTFIMKILSTILQRNQRRMISTSSLHLTYDKENDLDEDTKFNHQ